MKYCGVVTDRSWYEALKHEDRNITKDRGLMMELGVGDPFKETCRVFSDEVPMAGENTFRKIRERKGMWLL